MPLFVQYKCLYLYNTDIMPIFVIPSKVKGEVYLKFIPPRNVFNF